MSNVPLKPVAGSVADVMSSVATSTVAPCGMFVAGMSIVPE
jgi:hypothetical protein